MGLWLICIETGFGFIRNNSDWFRNRFLNGSYWFGINSQFETFAKVLDYCPTSSWSVSDNELHPGLILPVPDLTRFSHESTRLVPNQFPAMQYSLSLPGREPARILVVMGLTGAISTRVVMEITQFLLIPFSNFFIKLNQWPNIIDYISWLWLISWRI